MRHRTPLVAAAVAALVAAAPAAALVAAPSAATTTTASTTTTGSAAGAAGTTVAGVTGASAATAAAGSEAAPAAADAAVAAVTSSSTSSSAAAVEDTDQAGSTEVEMVPRSCGDDPDPHYDPPSGEGLPECDDPDTGQFDPSRTYEARHFTNEVSCGTDDIIVPGTEDAPVKVNGSADGDTGGGDGYLQACSDDEGLPIHGRVTLEGELSAGGGAASVTADGDETNRDVAEQLAGWAQVTVSGDGPSYRCGQAYEEGGRADASNATEEDTSEDCG